MGGGGVWEGWRTWSMRVGRVEGEGGGDGGEDGGREVGGFEIIIRRFTFWVGGMCVGV